MTTDLELDIDTMRAMLDATSRRVLDHLARVGDQHARGRTDAIDLGEPVAPESGTELDALLTPFFDEWVPRCLTTNGPGYLAYIPGGGIFPAALADLVADTTNRFWGARFASPPMAQLEANVLSWFADWMQFPPTARGIFTSGGSMAAFNAVVCAREKLLGPENIRRGVLYTSAQAHHSIAKSARLAGIARDRVRSLPFDSTFRMRVDALEAAIAEDRAAGLLPFLVVSSAGTTNTGAVDPLDAIADVCAREALWHHVDGAYGAFFHACPELRPLLTGLERADSLTLDPHKGLFLPYGTGTLLVRDGDDLRAVHALETPEYMPGAEADKIYDPIAYGPELSRGFPGLRVWLTVKLFGAARLRAAIAEKRALAVSAAEAVAQLPGITMVAPPQLSLFAFRVHDSDDATRALVDRIAERGRVFLSGCNLPGIGALARVCVLSFRTGRAAIDACVEEIAEVSRDLRRG